MVQPKGYERFASSLDSAVGQSPKAAAANPHANSVGAATDAWASPSSRSSGPQPVGTRWLRATVPSLAMAGALGALGYWRNRFQHGQTFLPERYPNGLWQPGNYGVTADDVWFESSDGTTLHGWWMPVARARGTVLYCHGNAGNITSRIGVYQYLKRLRLNVFAIDYRGYGRSHGRPSEQGVFADARAAFDWLVDEMSESPDRILLFGHSLGGAIAIDCAASRPAAGLVVQSSFTDLREMARERFRSVPLHWVARNQFRSLSKVPRLQQPKLFIHGTSDETVPIRLGERLFEHAAEPKEWFPVRHAGHNDVHRFGGFRYLWKLAAFSRRALSRARSSRVSVSNSPSARPSVAGSSNVGPSSATPALADTPGL
jgi:fermentation-respiration switch protein FrsA (DUF1100 family)